MDRTLANMRGMVTERDWNAVDMAFPGAHCFYLRLARKPHTFLNLLELQHSFGNSDKSTTSPIQKKSRRRK